MLTGRARYITCNIVIIFNLSMISVIFFIIHHPLLDSVIFFNPITWYSNHLLERILNSLGPHLLCSHVSVWKQTLVQCKDILYLLVWLFSCCWMLRKNTMNKFIWFHFKYWNINSIGNNTYWTPNYFYLGNLTVHFLSFFSLCKVLMSHSLLFPP